MEVKPGYKHTEVGVIPAEWDVSRLSSLLEQPRSVRYGIVQPGRFVPSGCLMLRSQDYSKGWTQSDEMHRVSSELAIQYRNARIRRGDLIMTVVGAGIGQVVIAPDWLDGAILSRSTARIAVDGNRASREFVKASLESPVGKRQILDCQKEGAQPVVSCQDLAKFFLPCPPRPEQRAIAAALSDVDALLGGLDRLIAKKRGLIQAAMQQLLTGQTRLPGFRGEWEVKRLADVAEFCAGAYLAQGDYRDGEYEVQGAGSVMGHHDVPNFPKAVSVVGRVGTVGRPRFMPKGCWVNNNAAAIVAREPCGTPEFVHLLLLTVDWSKATSVTAQPFLVVPALLDMEFSVPEPAEQLAISTILSDMDAELAALGARRDKTRNLKQAMMQELLTGKTRLVPAGAAHA